jgi:tRNA 5-methylaminomethyl-2-thiouridine biosynthesis bifunctional protein
MFTTDMSRHLAGRFVALSAGESLTVGETEFCGGDNFLRASQLFEQFAPPTASLDFFSIASRDDDLALSDAISLEFPLLSVQLRLVWRRRVPGWNRWEFLDGRVRLTLVLGEVAVADVPAVDVWLGNKLPTFNQKASDFIVRRVPNTAIVIGGGIAGCTAAYALAQRGVSVTLLERAPQLATCASGNPRGILHARFGAGDNALHRFVLAAYGYTLGLLDSVLPVDGVLRAECGLLQLAFSANEKKRIDKLSGRIWPPELLSFVDAAQASKLAGICMDHGGLWFPGGGWVVPPALCESLVDHPLIAVHTSSQVDALERTDAGWCVTDSQGEARQADVVVVCCAQSARDFAQFKQFSFTTVRGQISVLPETLASRSQAAVVCGDGYCAPSLNGVHVLGATHDFNDESIEVRSADHLENLQKLKEYAPALRSSLGEVEVEKLTGRAAVRCSVAGSMPLAGEVEHGLYCSLAHGTRGLLSAPLSAEVIAAKICGQLAPLPESILKVLFTPFKRIDKQPK